MSLPFPRHRIRKLHLLDGVWELCVLGDVDPDSINFGKLVFDRMMAVPGVYDTLPDLAGMRGLVAARTTVEVSTVKRGRLCFGGLGLWARVYVDGMEMGECHLPYSPWAVDITPSGKSEREIIVLLDNRFGPDRALLFDPFFDWYAHGGIYRNVVWHELPDVALERASITTTDLSAGRVSVRVTFSGSMPESVDLVVGWDGGDASMHSNLPLADGVATFESVVPDAKVWAPGSPNLHTLRIEFSDGSDDLVERTGLRVVEAHSGKVWLNGEAVEFKGVNRHEFTPLTGPAQSDVDRVADVAMLEDLGCNMVRGSHYQQNQHFLDLCDERGLLVWEETLGWQADKEHFANSRFAELQEQALRSMIRASVNHPSVICWGILNEGNSQLEESKPVYARLAEAARKEDSTRLITYACNHPFDCQNLHLCDLIGINMYPGWYAIDPNNPDPTDEIVPHVDKVLDFLDAQGHKDVPKMISEIGAGAIYGWRDRFEGHWSEEYQAKYLSEILEYLSGQKRWSGLTIWQFCDTRTYNGSRALGRPRAFNNKGLVDEYRRPKQAYDSVKKAFRGE